MLTAPSRIGPFEVLGCLGQGGMGSVYRVREGEGEPIALKIMSLADRSPFAMARFEREIGVLQKLCHPNLVQVLSSDCESEQPYYTMELIQGQTLLDHPAFARPPGADFWGNATPAVMRILQQLLSALDYVHRNGMVHRDLKPENLMLTSDGTVKIVDFGLVWDSAQSRLSQSGTIVGTLDYLAPEQAMGREVDRRSDLYSIGVLLYRICTGRLPLDAAEMAQQIVKVITEKPIPVRQQNPALAEPLARLIDELLEKEPAARPPCAADVWTRIEQAVGQPVGGAWECGQPTGAMLLFTPHFIGRENELRAVAAALTPGAALEISGPEGIGKSRLVEQVLREGQREGWKVLHVRFAEHDNRAFPALTGLLAQTGMGGHDVLAPFMPGSQSGPVPASQADRAGLFAAALRLLRTWASDSRVLFVADDAQWIDADSTALLEFLRANLSTERWSTITVVRDGSAHAIVVPPLNAGEVEALIASTLGDAPAAARLAPRIAADTGGNPYFVLELLSAMVGEGALTIHNGHWEMSDSSVRLPHTLREAVRRRLARLSERSLDLLRLAAVLGDSFDYALLRAAFSAAESEVLAALDALILQRLLKDAPDGNGIRISFLDKATRAVVLEDLNLPRRQALHRAAAEAIKARGTHRPGDSVELAVHYRAAGDTAAALTWLITAAMSASAAFAWDAASRLFEEAHQLGPLPREARLRWIEIRLELGQTAPASAECEALLKEPALTPLERARTLKLLARAHVDTQHCVEAFHLLRQALDTLGILTPAGVGGKVAVTLGHVLALMPELLYVGMGGIPQCSDKPLSAEDEELVEVASEMTRMRHANSAEIVNNSELVWFHNLIRIGIARRSLRCRSAGWLAESYAVFSILSAVIARGAGRPRFVAASSRCLQQVENPAARVRALEILVAGHVVAEQYAQGRPFALSWYETAQASGMEHHRARAATWLTLIDWSQGRQEEALTWCTGALLTASQGTHDTLRCLETLVRSCRGEPVAEAFRQARPALGPNTELIAWLVLGLTGFYLGQLEEAAAIFADPQQHDIAMSEWGPLYHAMMLQEMVERGDAPWGTRRAAVMKLMAAPQRHRRRPYSLGLRRLAEARGLALDGHSAKAVAAFTAAHLAFEQAAFPMMEAQTVIWGARHGAFTAQQAEAARASVGLR